MSIKIIVKNITEGVMCIRGVCNSYPLLQLGKEESVELAINDLTVNFKAILDSNLDKISYELSDEPLVTTELQVSKDVKISKEKKENDAKDLKKLQDEQRIKKLEYEEDLQEQEKIEQSRIEEEKVKKLQEDEEAVLLIELEKEQAEKDKQTQLDLSNKKDSKKNTLTLNKSKKNK